MMLTTVHWRLLILMTMPILRRRRYHFPFMLCTYGMVCLVYCTLWLKITGTLLPLISEYGQIFFSFFHRCTWKFWTNWLLKIWPHLTCVDVLLCETYCCVLQQLKCYCCCINYPILIKLLEMICRSSTVFKVFSHL